MRWLPFRSAWVKWAERWFPDAYVFVLLAVVIVALGAVLHGGSPLEVSRAFGDGFWNLIPFTMQIVLVAVTGYVVSMSSPAAAALRRLARVPRTGRGAIVFVGVLSILLSLVNWGLSLVSSALLVKEIARRTDIRLDYRAAGAAGYLGLGCGFTLGVTSSAAQLQANAASIPPSLITITGVIGFSETILTWQNGLTTLVVLLHSVKLAGASRDPDELEEDEEPATADAEGLRRFLERDVLPCFETRKKELANRPQIRELAFGEALDPDKLERLVRYKVHFDRKLERMLAMLLRLKDLRQGTTGG